jgi:VWFA-related protein
MRPLVSVTSILILSAGVALAQLRETVNVNLVEVPVTVLDRNGDPVRGLTADRFEIIDQGKVRPVTSFEMIDFASKQSLKSTSPLNPAVRRSFLLLFDLSFSSPVGRTKAQEAARNFLARGLHRQDLAAIGTVDVERGFRLLTAFTTDRSLLVQAIANPLSFRSSDPLQIAGTQVFEFQPETVANLPQADAIAEFQKDIARGEKRLNEQFNRSRAEREIRLLGLLARTLRMIPGRKEVVFFSEGFDARLIQGREARLSSDDQREEMDQITFGELWKVDSDARYGSSTSQSLLREMGRAFRGSDVTLHAVDIRGVRVDNDLQTGAMLNSNEGLFLIANPTGGTVLRNSNDLTADLDRMMRQQEVVYIVGFQPPVTSPGRFHELKVRVKDLPGARIEHRAGYYERGAENSIERALTTAEIVINDIPQSEIGVAALAAPFPTKGNAQVPVILEINGPDLLRSAPSNTLNVEIYIYAFDDDGLVRDRMFQRLSFDVAKLGDKLRESGLKYYATLSLPEGRYALKALVRVPETERKGFARIDMVVPPGSEVAVLPPFFFEEPGKWLMVKGGSHDTTNAAYPFQINGEPFIPSAAVRVRNGESRQFAVFVYNAAADEVAWETSLSDSSGGSHQANPNLLKQLQGEDVTKLMFQYAPADRDHGAARLDVTIHKKGSTEARTSSVPLTVQH